jgi:dimeric dUTPase (all-alpha-NTP-PPase superfamily)
MNLEKLFQTQKVLRERIGYTEPDRFSKLILALLVELGECANEWRGFKFWSQNQEPRTKAVRVPAMMEEDKEYYNPLLEEYVDGLHFVLEVGIELGFDSVTPYLVQVTEPLDMFHTVYKRLNMLSTIEGRQGKEFYYGELISNFFGLGKSLGFTWEQIEEAYFAKNEINHHRQEVGY